MSLGRQIFTTDEFVYDVLTNMVHHNELVISKQDIINSRSLKNIMNRLDGTFEITDKGEFLLLTKIKRFDAQIRYMKPSTR